MQDIDSHTKLPPSTKIPASHINVLNDLFKAAHTSGSDEETASTYRRVFAKDATWRTMSKHFQGVDDIVSSNYGRGDHPIRYLSHQIERVYVNDDRGDDLMLWGRVKFEMKDSGKIVDGDVSARADFVLEEGQVKLKYFQGMLRMD